MPRRRRPCPDEERRSSPVASGSRGDGMNIPAAFQRPEACTLNARPFYQRRTMRPAVSFLRQAGLGQAIDLVSQCLGDEESCKEVSDAAYCQLWCDLTDAADPLARFVAPLEMTASRRPYNHRIREARLLDQRPVGPFDGLLVARGLQVREGEGKLDQMTERIERAQARHVLQRLDGCVVAAREAINIGPGEPRLRAVRVQGYDELDQVRGRLCVAGQIGETIRP